MVRTKSLSAALAVVLLPLAAGCSICQAPDDCNYAAYGGVAPRVDMRYGRVGSAFAPAEGEYVQWSEGDYVPNAEPEPAAIPDPEAPVEPEDEGLETAY